MPKYPKFAPGSTPYMIDLVILWSIRIGASVFILSLIGITFFGMRQNFVIVALVLGLLAWVFGWIARRWFIRQYP